jgi:enediyne polyketide synthase
VRVRGGDAGRIPDRAEAGAEEPAGSIPLDPERDLYAGLLFQRGRFKRLRRYSSLSARACQADLMLDGNEGWFSSFLPGELVLGDAGVRDAALHAIQACIPHARIIPVGVDAIHTTARIGPGPDLSMRARERRREGDLFVYDLDLRGPDGAIVERWDGVHLKAIGTAPLPAAWAVPLFGPYLERRIEEMIPGAAIRVAIMTNGDSGSQVGAGGEGAPHATDLVIRRAAGLSPAVAIARRPDGKPELAGGPAISASHAADLVLSVAGAAPIACDLEPAVPRGLTIWSGLLGERVALAAAVAGESGEDLEQASTRVWTAIECLKKAGVPVTAPLVLDRVAPDGWVLFRSGSLALASCATRIAGGAAPLVVTVLCAPPGRAAGATAP